MEYVYVLHHVHELPNLEEDGKLIGVYASRHDAELAIERSSLLSGFKDFPSGFVIGEYLVGQDHWVEGFITWDPNYSIESEADGG